MWFPCFHHILEIILKGFIQARWKTSGPCDTIYKDFQRAWPTIMEKQSEMISGAKQAVEQIKPQHYVTRNLRDKLIDLFCDMEIKAFSCESFRGDYQEFIKVVQVIQI